MRFTRSTDKSKVLQAIYSFKPVRNSTGSLWGEAMTNPPKGHMPDWLYDALRASQPKYVVLSYGTPIAWLSWGNTRLVWTMPDVKYSRTTSIHQSFVRGVVSDR